MRGAMLWLETVDCGRESFGGQKTDRWTDGRTDVQVVTGQVTFDHLRGKQIKVILVRECLC